MKLNINNYIINNLIGMVIKDFDTGEVYGTVDDVLQIGINHVYSIKNGDKNYLIPAIADDIVDININSGIMTIRLRVYGLATSYQNDIIEKGL